MDAGPILATLARVLEEQKLEAVLIGNAAAALQGPLVTTVDFDFLFCKTPTNIRKLKAVAKSLGAVWMRPAYPVSEVFRLLRDEELLQVDFIGIDDGRSLRELRSRASRIDLGGVVVMAASPADVETGRHGLTDQERKLARGEQIRRLLGKPPHERTHFLRKKVTFRGSCL